MPKHVNRQVFDTLPVLYAHQEYFQTLAQGMGQGGGRRFVMGGQRGTREEAEVAYGDLQPGDILFHNDSKWNQFSRSHRFMTKHCSMMIDRLHRSHAVPFKGIIKSDMTEFKDPGLVFRVKPAFKTFASEAARLAIHMQSGNTTTADFGKYSRKRLFHALPGLHYYGKGAKSRLEKYMGDDHQFRAKNVTCAEYVILCYQLASDNDQHAPFIQLDAKNTLPWSLESYFLSHPNEWDLVGRIRGSECYPGKAHYA